MNFTDLVHACLSPIFGDMPHLTLRTQSLLLTPQLVACSVFPLCPNVSKDAAFSGSRKTHPSDNVVNRVRATDASANGASARS